MDLGRVRHTDTRLFGRSKGAAGVEWKWPTDLESWTSSGNMEETTAADFAFGERRSVPSDVR